MSDNRKQVAQAGRETCYFCESDGPIESHHIVPRRYDGSDHGSNIVDLCPTCHERLERLYDKEFYAKIGAAEPDAQVGVILSAAADEIEQMADDLTWQVDALQRKYIDVDIHDARENAVHRMADDEPEIEFVAGVSGEQRERMKFVRSVISDIEAGTDDGAPVEVINNQLIEAGLERSEIDSELERLRERGEVYEPVTDHLRTT